MSPKLVPLRQTIITGLRVWEIKTLQLFQSEKQHRSIMMRRRKRRRKRKLMMRVIPMMMSWTQTWWMTVIQQMILTLEAEETVSIWLTWMPKLLQVALLCGESEMLFCRLFFQLPDTVMNLKENTLHCTDDAGIVSARHFSVKF